MEWTVGNATDTYVTHLKRLNSLVGRSVQLEVPRVTPVESRAYPDVIRAQSVRTRAQAMAESERMYIEALTQPTQTSIPADDFEVQLDYWIRTIRVQVGTGDITHQKTQAIVNLANSHLNPFGGVARAIADAERNELINECEVYKQTNGILPISSVMHTTAGKLRPRIEYVIHTVGPCGLQ